jgi:hypothetical protein
MKAQEFRIPMNGSSTYAVDHLDLRRVLATRDYQVVFRSFPLIGTEAELRTANLRLIVDPA